MRISGIVLGGSMLVLAVLAGCGGGGGGGPTDLDTPGTPVASATVTASSSSNRFTPARVDLTRNGTVTWNFGSLTHNVTFDGGSAPANVSDSNNTQVARAFPNAGTFNYHCTIHPGMAGRVVVQ
jgi:plastocyanin